jgi:hypothetical protein
MHKLSRIVLVFSMLGCGGSDADIDDPCYDAYDCAVDHSECIDLGDGVNRCEKVCKFDSECGDGSECAFSTEAVDDVGFCVRLCKTASDCATGNWACVTFSDDRFSRYCALI